MKRSFFPAFILSATLGMVSLPAFAQDSEQYEYAHASAKASETLLLDVAIAGDRLVSVGEYGHIIYSDDKGESWMQAESVPTRATLTSIFFLDTQTGYAVGHDAVVLKTEDGGKSWDLRYSAPDLENPLFGVYFKDALHGFAVGGFSFMVETNDGGMTWQERTLIPDSIDDFHLNDLFADKAGRVFVPAEYGYVYRSDTNGDNFSMIATGYEGSFWGGQVLNNGTILVWGMRGNVYRSTDGGNTWQKADTGTDRSVSGGTQLADGTVVLTGLSGLVLVSRDNGKTFKETVRSDRTSFATVAAIDADKVLLFGDPGVKPQDVPE